MHHRDEGPVAPHAPTGDLDIGTDDEGGGGHSWWWMVACCAPMVLVGLALLLGLFGTR